MEGLIDVPPTAVRNTIFDCIIIRLILQDLHNRVWSRPLSLRFCLLSVSCRLINLACGVREVDDIMQEFVTLVQAWDQGLQFTCHLLQLVIPLLLGSLFLKSGVLQWLLCKLNQISKIAQGTSDTHVTMQYIGHCQVSSPGQMGVLPI